MKLNAMQLGLRRLAMAWALAAVAGCGGEDGGVAPDPSVTPLVGDWRATSMVVTSVANPDVAPDLIGLGASFTLNIQPSGQYTAILIFAEQASTEIGTLSVSGNVVTMKRSFPSADTATSVYTLQGNHLTLDGDTEFDFNLDGTVEAAVAHIEFDRQ